MKIEKERAALHQKNKEFEKQKENDEKQMEKGLQRLKQEKMLFERIKKDAEKKNKSELFQIFSFLFFHLFLLSILFMINDELLFQLAKVVKRVKKKLLH